ncbi:MAG: exosortase/archaeosortase family protein [Candidatus Micrarchaeota archaeon]
MKEAKDAVLFIVLFLLVAVPAYFVLGFFAEPFSEIAAYSSKVMLGVAGINASITFEAGTAHIVSSTPSFDAEIGDLCWGRVEIAVLAGIIMASWDRKLGERLKGVLLGIAVLLVLNPIRIAVSLAAFNPQNSQASALLHDFLFRITLVVVLVTYYAVWYYWLSKKRK